MKIKFIPKKERQALKLQKDTPSNHPNQLIQPIKQDNDTHLMKHVVIEEDEQEQRERSRDKTSQLLKKWQKLTTQQQKERENAKKNYLGLVKKKQPNRFLPNYRTSLNFQWDNKDDTFNNSTMMNSSLASKIINAKSDHILAEKDKGWKDKQYCQMTQRDWRIFREDNNIFIKGGRVPYPIRDWTDINLDAKLIENLKGLGFTKPKPIQMQAIPIGLLRKDLIGLAPTGEGKTVAYLIPAIQYVLPLERVNPTTSSQGPYILILVPSRQLAQQIETQFQKISKGLGITAAVMVGGKQIEFQALTLQKGLEMLIGTPGRIKQMYEKRYLTFERCCWVIIDEADKMISQNLVEEVEFILNLLGSQAMLHHQHDKSKVTHMFSATMAPQIQKLVRTYLSNPSYISIGDPGSGKKEIQQYVQFIDQGNKNNRLGKILKTLPAPIIVFVNMRSKCQPLVNLIEQKWNRKAIDYHGNKTQQQRERAIQGFRSGKYQILVATDLAGRGLDVIGITAVINYDAPKNITQFVHRAGRTGRAGMKGKAYTLLTATDEAIFYDLREYLERNGFKVPQGLQQHPSAHVKPGSTAFVPRRKQIVYTN